MKELHPLKVYQFTISFETILKRFYSQPAQQSRQEITLIQYGAFVNGTLVFADLFNILVINNHLSAILGLTYHLFT